MTPTLLPKMKFKKSNEIQARNMRKPLDAPFLTMAAVELASVVVSASLSSAGGESVEPVALSLGSVCDIPGASASIDGALESFIERFIHAYVDFGANKDRDAEGNFAVLSGYLVAGTDLYQTCYATVENIAWASTGDLVYHDIGCYDLMPLGNGDYVCHITYDVSYQFATTQRDIVADYVVLIRPEGSSYRVVAMSPEL